MRCSPRRLGWLLAGLALADVGTAALLPPIDPVTAEMPSEWRYAGLPGKLPTRFSVTDVDGARALRIEADRSYGNLLHEMHPAEPAHTLDWQWRVDLLNEASDLTWRLGDDTTLKVCAMFDMPLQQVPFAERQVLRVASVALHEPLPTATVCYVWDAHLAPGTALQSPVTRRVRYLVLEGPGAALNVWKEERRDLASDFLKLFGDESPAVPRVSAIAVGADADNTQGHSLGWVRRLHFES